MASAQYTQAFPAGPAVDPLSSASESRRRPVRRSRATEEPVLPKFRDGFLRAELTKEGDLLTLPGRESSKVTRVDRGYDQNRVEVVQIYTEAGGQEPSTYMTKAYIPVTPAWD